MRSGSRSWRGMMLAALTIAVLSAAQAQADNPDRKPDLDRKPDARFDANLDTRGQVTVDGRQAPYRIRHLPVSSFPDLPAAVAAALTARGCVIPQTYEAKRPENVIHASLERAGSRDWAVLCSAQGEVSLLVFFASGLGNGAEPTVLAKRAETKCLEAQNATGQMGFDWGIDPAGPKRVHDAQLGMAHRLPPLDHDGVAESQVDGKTIYHLYRNGAWETVATE